MAAKRSDRYCVCGKSLQNQRPTNMDRLLLRERDLDGQHITLAVVCDGVGGMQDGDFAAAAAVEKLSEWFDAVSDCRRIGMLLYEAVEAISKSIEILAKASGKETASTLSALLLANERYYLVQSGDSRIYRYAGGCLEQLSRDQAIAGKLTGYIGLPSPERPIYDEMEDTADAYLLCTDGITKRLNDQFLQEQMGKLRRRNLSKMADALIRSAVESGEKDNITLAVLWKEQ